jgi:probable blue pigment (indigoidine) exporter
MKMKRNSFTALVTLAAPVSWGTTYVTVTELLPAGRPLSVAARVLPAGLLLVAVGLRSPGWRPRGSAQWRRCVALAVANFGLFFPLLTVGVYRLPGGVAASVGGLQPLLVSALARVVSGRALRRSELMVGLVAAAGVGLVVLRPGAQFDGLGLAAAVTANVSFAFGVVLSGRGPAPVNRTAWTGWQLLISAAVLVPLAAVAEPRPAAGQWTGWTIWIGWPVWAGVAYLSLIATGLAFLTWFAGIRRLPVSAPPLLGLAAPATGALLGWVLLGQALSMVQLIGLAVTFGAIGYGAVGTGAGSPRPGAGQLAGTAPSGFGCAEPFDAARPPVRIGTPSTGEPYSGL